MNKQLLLLFAFFFLLENASSQNLNKASHNNIDQMFGVVSIHSKSYYLESSYSCCGKNVYVGGIDQNGNSIFKTDITSAYDFPKKIVKTQDNCLLVFGSSMQACDVGGTKDFIAKVDTNGVVLFRNFIQSSWMQIIDATDIASCPDTSFYLSTDSVVYKYSKTGQILNFFCRGSQL